MYERVAKLPDIFTDIRDEYLEQYSGKNLEGLDIDKVNQYFAANDLAVKPYILVTPADIERVHNIDKAGLLRGTLASGGREGLYSPEMGISIILRSQTLEARNSAAYTEGLIVHEGAHSMAGIACYLREKGPGSYLNARSGFALPQLERSSGFLFEESWGEMHRGRYMAQHYDDGSLDLVRRAIGWKRGPEEVMGINLDGRLTPLPFKYLKIAENGTVTALQSSLAAFSMELLIQVNPDIYPAMYKGRTEHAGLSDLARQVEAIQPHLYATLRRLDYVQGDFARGLHMIIDEVISDPDVAWR